jgi:poly-gamma-glutamate capsule biosynthesis protein CapA/YwtB (metallophosphatase superfamily)
MGKSVMKYAAAWGDIFPRLLQWMFLILLLGMPVSGCAATSHASTGVDLSAYPWVYLRDGQPEQKKAQETSLIVVGDVMLGRRVSNEADPLGGVTTWLSSTDLTAGNLECAIAPEGAVLPTQQAGSEPGGPYLLVASSNAVGQLSQAGFDLLGLANNHALDRGLQGLAETGTALEKAGLLPLGAGPDSEHAYMPVIKEVNGLRLAFLAFNAVPSPRGPEWSGEVRQTTPESGWALAGWERERALAAVQSAHQQADAVIVSIHWGYEYETRVDPAQRDMARALVAAGADLVIGHHPHVVQELEKLPKPDGGQALVAYSLGNFVFDQGFEATGQGLALRVFFDPSGLSAVQALPVHSGVRPALATPGTATELLERIGFEDSPETLSKPGISAWRCEANNCSPVDVPVENAGGGIFSVGENDLNGDGKPELVTLQAGHVHIEGTGLPKWDSLPDWQVNDLALGDANNDGRQEVLLALRKADRSGVLLSHPFVLGYREGKWQLLWGGSAVSDPIQEVALGDVDGDGLEELVVLEARHDGSGQAISVWRWNGWGFSQVWRGESGNYRNLRLGGDSGRIVIIVDRA